MNNSMVIDTGSKRVRSKYRRLAEEKNNKLSNLFQSTGIDHIKLLTNRDYVLDLVKFFRKRMKKG
ncbi:hypothetical protein ACFLZQ_07610 [Thermodesulfobacteriota bacterium]